MFRLSGKGSARADEEETVPRLENEPAEMPAPPLKPFVKGGSHMPSKPTLPQGGRADVPRRILDIPGMQRKPTPPEGPAGEGKKLVVGREIRLSGAISSCDCLVVEGQVEADLTDAHTLVVAKGGVFSGTAIVENAEISGRFEGELTVRDAATIRPGGLVKGSITYANVVMERGGVIEGVLAPLPKKSAAIRDEAAPEGEAPAEAAPPALSVD